MNLKTYILLPFCLIILINCQGPNLESFKQKTTNFFEPVRKISEVKMGSIFEASAISKQDQKEKSIDQLVGFDKQDRGVNVGMVTATKRALAEDPIIISAKENLNVKRSAIGISNAQKDFLVSGSIYAGIEDISDQKSGVAMVLSAKRLLFDGGKLDAQIESDRHALEASRFAMEGLLNKRAGELLSLWVDLERYEKLNTEIESRLRILDPLIRQLEKVAEVGVGEISQVTAAQRTVSSIRVTQTDISERLEQARINFLIAFGALPSEAKFELNFLNDPLKTNFSEDIALEAPALMAEYMTYLSLEASLASLELKDKVNVGLESRFTRPFGGSGYDSDESIGLVLSKTIYQGDILASEIQQAEARVRAQVAKMQAVHRDGELLVRNSMQTVAAMDMAIALAKSNAEITASEIQYLRKQLVIGGSTLETVLSAEARLYDAEAKAINFQAQRVKAQLTVLASIGYLTGMLGL